MMQQNQTVPATALTPALARPRRGWRLPQRSRKALATFHIIASVALLGNAADMLVLAVTAARTSDPSLVRAAFLFMQVLVSTLGIPLLFAALLSGLVLALFTPWGLFRHKWVTAKLMLLLATLLCGALALRPWIQEMVTATAAGATLGSELGGTTWKLIGGEVFQISALTVATVFSVYKPK